MAGRMGTLAAGAAAGGYAMNQSGSWSNLWGSMPKSPWDQSSGGPDVTALRGELSRLAALVSDLTRSGGHNGKPTIVQLADRNGWTVLVVPAVAGGAGLFIYCKLTGTGLADLLFASRNSMASLRNTVEKGLSSVWDAVHTLGRKQDTLQDNQDQLLDKLCEVDEKATRNHNQLDSRMQDVHSGVQSCNQGIYMLMNVVSDVTTKIGLHNSRASQALHRYLSGGPAWTGGSSANSISGSSTSTQASQLPLPLLPSSNGVEQEEGSFNNSFSSGNSRKRTNNSFGNFGLGLKDARVQGEESEQPVRTGLFGSFWGGEQKRSGSEGVVSGSGSGRLPEEVYEYGRLQSNSTLY